METAISDERIPREQVFGVGAPPAPVLDPDEVRKSVYQGKVQAEVCRIDHDLRLRCLQGWFFRCAWSEKFRFVAEICDLTTGVYVLEQVLKCLDSIYTKDVIDSFARDRIIVPYDVIPTDDSRSMTEQELFRVRQEDTLWFLNLDASSQVDVIVKLLKLGGGGLMFSAYKEIDKIYRERREMNMVLDAVDTSIRELTEGRSVGNDSKIVKKSEEINPNKYTVRREEQINRRNAELSEFKKKCGLSTNGKKGNGTEIVDYVQVLPVWLNRKIMLQMEERELGELKRMGKYWTKMIEEAIREKNGRIDIDEKVRGIGGCDGGGGGGEDSADDGKETQDVPVLGREALLAELRLRHSDLVCIQKKNRCSKEVKIRATVWEEFCFEGIVCSVSESSKVLAASTSNRSIRFYSLRTGARMQNVVSAIPCNITSMAVHNEGFHVVVGCEDGSLFCINIRNNEKKITYKGHSGPVFRIHATDERFVSAAEDRTIKHFDLWSGLCLFCGHVDESITSMIVLKERWQCVIAGTAQGKLVFIDLGRKKIYRKVVVHERKVKGIAEVGSLLVTHSADRSIRMWSVNHLEEGNCGEIRPFASIRLKSIATAVECLGNEIFAACADGKVRLICKLTGAAKRVVEVTQKKPIAGIYVMQEKDTTKMIMWHEGGIEMRSFSTEKDSRKKKKKKRGENAEAGRDTVLLSRRKFFSILPFGSVHPTLPPRKIKRYRATRREDRELVHIDRSCTARKVREIDQEQVSPRIGDAFTEMIKRFQVLRDVQLTTFTRMRSRDEPPSSTETLSNYSTDESSVY